MGMTRETKIVIIGPIIPPKPAFEKPVKNAANPTIIYTHTVN
jgi:hypothetical protein